MTNYQRITYSTPKGRSRTVILRVSQDGEYVRGLRVKKDGDLIENTNPTGITIHSEIIAASDITKRVHLRMNNVYAELEPIE